MKTTQPENEENATTDAPPTVSALKKKGRAMTQAFRQVFGIPDYDRYLAHCAQHHAGEPVLSRREFFAQSIDRKYGKSGPRCC